MQTSVHVKSEEAGAEAEAEVVVEAVMAVVADKKGGNKLQRLMETNLVQFTQEQTTNGRIASTRRRTFLF